MRSLLATFIRRFGQVDRVFKRVVEVLLTLVLAAMIALTFLQVILRNFFDSGVSWADVASRHLVLWIAFLGAMLVTRNRQHISIDLVSRLVSKRARNIQRFFLDIVACVVCAFLAAAAVTLVIEEQAMGTILFLNIPLWTVQLIIPVGFTVMAIEFALGVLLDVLRYFYDGMVSRLAAERRPL